MASKRVGAGERPPQNRKRWLFYEREGFGRGFYKTTRDVPSQERERRVWR